MSQVNGVGSSAYYLAQYLSSTSAADGAGSTSGLAALEAVAGSSSSTPVVASATTSSTPGATSSGTTPTQDLRSQLETAVTNALNGLGPNSSPADVLSAIRNAVQTTLKANGIDTSSTQTQGTGGHHHGHHGGAAAGGAGGVVGSSPASSSGTSSTGSGDSDGDSDGSSNTSGAASAVSLLTAIAANTSPTSTSSTSTSSSGTSSNSGGAQTLGDTLASLLSKLNSFVSANANATDPTQQLNNPLLAAATGSVNGQTGSLNSLFAQLFQGFPNGSGVDVNA